MIEFVILTYLTIHISLKFIWLGQRQPGTTFYGHVRLHAGHILQMVVLLEMLLEVLTIIIRQQSHIRLTRALRPIFFVDNFLMRGVRRYKSIACYMYRH